jgi:tetraacyldisaccharide 4'-kinase
MEPLLEDIVCRGRCDIATLPIRAPLRCLSLLYRAGVRFRTFLYDRGALGTERVPCTVVSIGAIALGGTGKTPVTIMTARLLLDAGYRIAVVSRGYRRASRGVLVVSDGSGRIRSPWETGDEPHLIASSLPGVPVVVGEHRAKAAALACDRFHPDIIVLDDGFQHRRLRRDADVVTLDAAHPFGNGFLLPRGTLREPPEALARARAIVFTRCTEDLDHEQCERAVRPYNSRAPVFFSRHAPVRLRPLGNGENIGLGSITGKRVAALSNIAHPDSFHRMLASLGADILRVHVMPDHHRYRNGELERIERDAADHGADMLVMTAKDERNLPEGYTPAAVRSYVLDMEAVLLSDHEHFLDFILGKPGLSE